MSEITISELHLYPLKSAKGLMVSSFDLDERGPKNDRRWMLVDEHGKFLTQRKIPKMCLIETRLINDSLELSVPNNAPIIAGQTNTSVEVEVWRDRVLANDCGDLIAQYLFDYLGKSCRLVEMPKQTKRLVDTDYAHANETVAFADGFPILVVSQASLDDFNTKLTSPITMARFRPNIVVDGCEPYAEDEWQEVTIGNITLSLVKPCSRCIMPSIDQTTGEKQMSVNQALLKYRRRGKQIFFGKNALHRGLGALTVGDQVTIA